MYLNMLGRHYPDMDCSRVFEVHEWQSVYAMMTKKPPPQKPPKLKEMMLMIAKLGGFLGRKGDGHPGIKAMWVGLQRMKDMALAWETFLAMREESYV